MVDPWSRHERSVAVTDHWRQFVDDVPWFLDGVNIRDTRAEARGPWRPRSGEFTALFPELARLLASSFVTDVVVAGRDYVLHSWETEEGSSRSWLCPRPSSEAPRDVYAAHRVLLESFGGIVERSNELTDSWLLNHNDVLTADEAEHDATFIESYAWAFEGVPGGIPIDLRAYYSIAREANGNTTLCNRTTGQVLLFAPDHSFDHILPFDGCPEYSLYRIPSAPTFSAWVAAVATQWTVA
jgi:hypothetical protein